VSEKPVRAAGAPVWAAAAGTLTAAASATAIEHEQPRMIIVCEGVPKGKRWHRAAISDRTNVTHPASLATAPMPLC
jgi:hypothetical protein